MADIFDQAATPQATLPPKATGDVFDQAAPTPPTASTTTSMRPQTFMEQHPSISAALDSVGNVLQGGAKGLGNTAYHLTNALNGGLRAVLPFGEKYIPASQPKPAGLEPQGTAQKIGYGLEQGAEFLAPSEAISAGAKAIDAGVDAAKLSPFLSKALSVTGRAALEGGSAAAVARAQGNPAGPAAAFGAGGSLVGDALTSQAPAVQAAAEKQYSKFLAPTTKQTKYMATKVTPELLDRRQLAFSGQGLESKAAQQTNALGQQIDAAVSKVPDSVKPNIQNVVDDLEKYKQGFIVNGVPINEGAVNATNSLQNTVQQLGQGVSYQSLNKARQILDDPVAGAGGYSGRTLAEGTTLDAQKEAANAIRRELSQQSPDIAKINAEYHFWSQVGDVIGATNDRQVGQQGGLGRIMAPMIGAGAGFVGGSMSSHGGLGAAGGAALLLAAHEAIRSPAWRTTSAVVKNALADAMASGNAAKVAQIAGRIAAGTSAQTSNMQSALSNTPSQ